MNMLSWGGLSEASIRQAESPLRFLRNQEQSFSSKLQLSEDFRGGESPRFNTEGELAPEFLPLVEKGKLVNALVNARSAKEYGVPSNGALRSESLRAPSVAAGTLCDEDVLAALGTGLYLSNLHYLNWSDQARGRITGMTRYACFWVEEGKLVAPIENLRFDDTIFRLLGSEVIDFSAKRTYLPDTGSYYHRAIGGAWMPGMLAANMRFTL